MNKQALIVKVTDLVSKLDLPGVDLSTAWGQFLTHNDDIVCLILKKVDTFRN